MTGPAPGARPIRDGGCRFLVWAPAASRVEIRLIDSPERIEPLAPVADGYHEAILPGVPVGARYFVRLDGSLDLPDPASRWQPEGVHGPSAVLDPSAFGWTDGDWRGLPLERHVLYEIHAGTFTREGTFDAIIPRLDDLADLGVTALELMPVAQFPGRRNWGYDGVLPYSAQDSYGGPEGLCRLVDACHARGLAVVLDVVYNHLGPEGNHLGRFGPYFSDRHRTPWGEAINFDGPGSDEVRQYFVENALYWITDCHVDGLRLDAIHGIVDTSARPFLRELADEVHSRGEDLGRRVHVIAESDLNDVRVVLPPEVGGLGHDAQWNDDFHHALHALLTGERQGYYRDFGTVGHLAKAFREGFVLTGERSTFRRRRHGSPSREIPPGRFVVFAQNHDQIGNRPRGDRLSTLVPREALKVAAAAVLLASALPLLFMGEEYGETAPFLYFVSHTDPDLIDAVRRGRRDEFASFDWEGEVPDPQDESTFERSRPSPDRAREEGHGSLRDFHAELLRLRREIYDPSAPTREKLVTGFSEDPRILWVSRGGALLFFNFSQDAVSAPSGSAAGDPPHAAERRRRIDSSDTRWGGSGAAPEGRANPMSFQMFA